VLANPGAQIQDRPTIRDGDRRADSSHERRQDQETQPCDQYVHHSLSQHVVITL
jgi:hypothetical protein